MMSSMRGFGLRGAGRATYSSVSPVSSPISVGIVPVKRLYPKFLLTGRAEQEPSAVQPRHTHRRGCNQQVRVRLYRESG